MNRLVHLFYLNLLFIPFCRHVDGQIPKTVLCVDRDCTGIISTATSNIKYYNKGDWFTVSFKHNSKINVIAKPENEKEAYWGVEVEGDYGYVPKSFLKEKSLKTTPRYRVNGIDFLQMKNVTPAQNIQDKNNLPERVEKNVIRDEKVKDTSLDHNIPNDKERRATQNRIYEDQNINARNNIGSPAKRSHNEVLDEKMPDSVKKKKPDYSNHEMLQEKPKRANVVNPEINYLNQDVKENIKYKPIQDNKIKETEFQEPGLEVMPKGRRPINNHPNEADELPPVDNIQKINDQYRKYGETSKLKAYSLDIEKSSEISGENISSSDSFEEVSSENITDSEELLSESEEEEIDSFEDTEDSSLENSVPMAILDDVVSNDTSSDGSSKIPIEDNVITKNESSTDVPVEKHLDETLENKSTVENASSSNIPNEIQSKNTSDENQSIIENTLPSNISIEIESKDTIEKNESPIQKTSDGNIPIETQLNNTEIDNKSEKEIPLVNSISSVTQSQDTSVETKSTIENISDNEPPLSLNPSYLNYSEDPSINSLNEEQLHVHSHESNPSGSSTEKPTITETNEIFEEPYIIEENNINNDTATLDFMNNDDNSSYIENTKEIDSGDKTNSDKDHNHMNHESSYASPSSHLPPQLPLFQAGSFKYFSEPQEKLKNTEPNFNEVVAENEKLSEYDEMKYPSTEIPLEQPLLSQDRVETTSSDLFTNDIEYKINENSNGDMPYVEDRVTEDVPISPSLISFKIFTNFYESISNVFKSYNNQNNADDVLVNNVIHSDDMRFQEKTLASSIFTETSQCSIDDRQKLSWSEVSADLIFWLVISAVSVLMFTLGYYYLDNKKEDGKLLAMVNSLQKELLCSSKECILLKEELSITKEKLIGIEDNSFGSNEMVVCLKKELAESEQKILDLQERLAISEDEIANSTEAALELQSILDEQLKANDKSNSLAFTITQLQSQLDDQQTTMNATKSQLTGKIEENEFLMMQISEVNSRCANLQRELNNTQESLAQAIKESENKSLQINELTATLEKSIQHIQEQKNIEIKMIQMQLENNKTELNNVKATLKGRIHEVQSLQDSIKALKLDDKNIKELLDVTHTKADLVQITTEKALLSEKVENDQKVISELTENLSAQNSSIMKMKEQLTESENKALEATTRLEVLTNYFNQKEADLLKELSTKESLWISQQGEAMSTIEKIESIQKEIQQYKETAESMRREVVEQEAAWRAKAAALEQRAHEQWLARRAAERAAEALAREAQALRQRLAAPSPDKRVVSPLNAGEQIPEPAFMPPLGALGGMLPPPHLGFLPPPLGGPMMLPPPLPPLPPHRPPPLGRLSSPPPLPSRSDRYSDSRYSPDRPYSPPNRGRSPFSNSDDRRRGYNNRRYDDNRYYDSEEDRRSRRYETETDFSPVNTLPPSPIATPRNHKGVSSGSGQSYESIERFK